MSINDPVLGLDQRLSPEDRAALSVLVVDDSRTQRAILGAILKRRGYSAILAENGEDALEICRDRPIDMVICDWTMPGMSGLDLCREYRRILCDRYGYFILLAAVSERAEISHSLEVGADDFLTKPVSAAELTARITAGHRILRMQWELRRKHQVVEATLGKLRSVHDQLDRDLMSASKLQRALLKDSTRRFGKSRVSTLVRPKGHVGGDMVGSFRSDDGILGLYAIDVSGHGVASALVTTRLAGHFSDGAPAQNIALRRTRSGRYVMRDPHYVAQVLNRLTLKEFDAELYFTMLLACVDLQSGRVSFVQAGHPHPMLRRRHGVIEQLGHGGFPVGLLPDADFMQSGVQLMPGDRFVICSDGVTEAQSPEGQYFSDVGYSALLTSTAGQRGDSMLSELATAVDQFTAKTDRTDDLSALVFDYRLGD